MKQLPLIAPAGPPGLLYLPDFISPDEETSLLGEIALLALEPYRYGPYTAHRKVALFEKTLPEFIRPLRDRAASALGRASRELTSILFTHYAPGVGIGWHHDAPVYDAVFGVSLLGRCAMAFRLKRGDGFDKFRQELERRSAYALTGAARRRWQHGISKVREERYSITFRSRAV